MNGLPAGAVVFNNATQTGPPPNVKLLVPSINTSIPVVVYTFVTRPETGGGLYLLHFCTADGIQATINLLERFGIEDAFGASPFLSDFSATIKAMVNAKVPNTANGNDRMVFPVDSGISAFEP